MLVTDSGLTAASCWYDQAIDATDYMDFLTDVSADASAAAAPPPPPSSSSSSSSSKRRRVSSP
eukprot:1284665-Rhodomonas_salina.1